MEAEILEFVEKAIREGDLSVFEEVASNDTGCYATDSMIEALESEVQERIQEMIDEGYKKLDTVKVEDTFDCGGYESVYTILLSSDRVAVVEFTKGGDTACDKYAYYTVYVCDVLRILARE